VVGRALVNGTMMPLSEATIPVTDPAFTLGWSVFETLGAVNGVLNRLDLHLDRLRISAAEAQVDHPGDELLRRELREIACAMSVDARIRVTLTAGGNRVIVAVPLDPARRFAQVRVARSPAGSEPVFNGAIKHSSRAPWAVAVARSGVDEVLLVRDGAFVEATTAAIFAVRNGVLWTSPFEGVLASTTVTWLLDLAAQLGIPVKRAPIPSDGPWDALYLASATRVLAPVVELDGVPMPGWDPIGRQLAEAV